MPAEPSKYTTMLQKKLDINEHGDAVSRWLDTEGKVHSIVLLRSQDRKTYKLVALQDVFDIDDPAFIVAANERRRCEASDAR